MNRIEPYKKLLDILCELLVIENDLILTINSDERTKYNKSQNAINICVDGGIGIIRLFMDLGHEVFHVKQHREKTIVIDKEEYHSRIEKYKKDEWMMYFFYKFEREAQSFAWILTGCINDFFYENHKRQDAYQYYKKLYSTMMKTVVSDSTLINEKEETDKLLDECYSEFIKLYKDLIMTKRNEFIDWHKIYFPPQSVNL
ncbi:MAG: hypothetical protein ABH890_07635 [Bacillota bacterium]